MLVIYSHYKIFEVRSFLGQSSNLSFWGRGLWRQVVLFYSSKCSFTGCLDPFGWLPAGLRPQIFGHFQFYGYFKGCIFYLQAFLRGFYCAVSPAEAWGSTHAPLPSLPCHAKSSSVAQVYTLTSVDPELPSLPTDELKPGSSWRWHTGRLTGVLAALWNITSAWMVFSDHLMAIWEVWPGSQWGPVARSPLGWPSQDTVWVQPGCCSPHPCTMSMVGISGKAASSNLHLLETLPGISYPSDTNLALFYFP